jgi:hypothetical protein
MKHQDTEVPFHYDADTSYAMLRQMEPWPMPTYEQVRHLLMNNDIMVLAPADETDSGETKLFLTVPQGFQHTAQAGRAFDVGHMPNALIKREAFRGCQLFEAGHIGHPFTEPYLLYHTWEGGGSLLLVDAMDWHAARPDRYQPGTFMVCEMQPVMIAGRRMLMVADLIHVFMNVEKNQYGGSVMRNVLNDMALKKGMPAGEGLANLAEPVMASMLLLATDGVPVERIEPPEKLNRARLKARKLAIPPHWRVETAGYVTALSGRKRVKGEAGGGHHASPIPHIRRGHVRRLAAYHGGGTRWIADALVNVRDPNAPLARSFYAVQREKVRP